MKVAHNVTTKVLVEDRIDHGLTDLEIAKEQLIRHSNDMPISFNCEYVLEHLDRAINILRELYL